MKRIIFITLFWGSLMSVYGKVDQYVPQLSDYQSFLKSKMLVVLEPGLMSDYNGVIKKAIENNWHLTSYEFISHSEFVHYRNDSQYSFLMVTVASFNKDRTKASYNFLSLLRGGKGTSVTNMPDLCSIPLSYLKVEDDSYSYKVEAFLRFIQNHVELMIQNPSFIGENSLKYYNKNKGDLKGKILYLTKEDLAGDVDTSAEISKVYPYPFHIVSREEVADAIAQKRRDIVFLHKVGPEKTRIKARVYKILVGAADPQFYYFNYEMVKQPSDDAFQAKDLKRLR